MIKINQKKHITTLLLFVLISNLNAQELLKEVSKTFDNGQPMFIDYLETENLKKVKTELFNEKGTLVFSINFNKESGLPDGEFYDLINKGYFENGVLNCENCMLVEANSPSVYTYNNERMNTEITVGDVVKGRLVGEVKKYEQYEETYNKVDWNSTRRYVAAGAGIGFRDVKTYTTGKFTKTLVDTKVYNNNGVLDGTVNLTYTVGRYSEELKLNARLNVKNGIIKSLVSYDEKGVQRDSLSNEQKIWKVNYKYVKNYGFLIFSNPQSNYFEGKYIVKEDYLIFIGGYLYPNVIRYNMNDIGFDTGGPLMGLDNNGMYTISTSFEKILYGSYPGSFFKGNRSTTTRDRGEYINLFFKIYNFLVNDIVPTKKYVFKNYVNYMGRVDLHPLLKSFNKKYNNKFYKYLKYKKIKEVEEKLPLKPKQNKEFSFLDINNYIISFSNYLKAFKQTFELDFKEVQEMLVLNKKTNEYDLINLDKLIKLSEEKEAKKKKEKEAVDGENIRVNKELEKTTDNSIFLKNIKLKLTSDKNSSKYSSIISKTVKRYNKSYDLKIEFLELFTSNDNKTYYRYIFNNKTDLESLKKVFSQYAQPVYIDLDNKAPSIYYKN